jgi:hypothetical protein
MNLVFLAQVRPSLDKIEEFVFTNTNISGDLKSESIAETFEDVWKVVMDGNLYRLVCSIGLLIAIFAVGFWCVKFYISLEEGGYKPAVNEMIFPVILVLLLSNGGINMRNATIATRNVMNNVNNSVNKVVSLDIDMRQAINTLATSQAAKDTIVSMFESCNAKVNTNEFGGCVQNRKVAADILVKKTGTAILSSGNAVFQAKQSLWLANIRQTADALSQILTPQQAQERLGISTESVVPQVSIPMERATPNDNTLDSPVLPTVKNVDVFSADTYDKPESMKMINNTIMSFRKAFLYIIEVMMLVTALIGPIFVALSMFPIGTKPLLAWGTSFLSLGFCKICFSLISGLSAIAFVYAGPDNTDMTVVAVVLGLLAPVLSFGIASGSGIGALNNIGTVAQNFGINTGTGYYNPSVGNGLSDTNKDISTEK